MEEKGSSSSSSSHSRWNPTKEQIAILEALYKQGIRTPSAEQIQQITIKLREFGMTEGKNVFYWFQNYKARQRQKLKQERFAYYSRLLNNEVSIPVTTPVMAHVPHLQNASALHRPQGCNNVVCGPYLGFYQPQYPNMSMPRTMQINPVQDQFQRMELPEYNNNSHDQKDHSEADNNSGLDVNDIETLQLFPLHPTGILDAEKSESSQTCASICHSDQTQVDDYEVGYENNNNNSPTLFNFFG